MKISNQNKPNIVPLEKSQTKSLRPRAMDPRAQLQQASQMYEKHFLGEMVKAMRNSVQKGGLVKDSMADQIYTQQLDSEYVKSWVTRGGVGLAKLIEKQMLQHMGIAMPPQTAPRDANGMFKVQQNQEPSNKQMHYKIESSKPQSALELPWSGKVSAWFPEENSSGGKLLLNHGSFESLWKLPKKPDLQGGMDLAAGSLLLNTEPGVSIDLAIRAKLHSA